MNTHLIPFALHDRHAAFSAHFVVRRWFRNEWAKWSTEAQAGLWSLVWPGRPSVCVWCVQITDMAEHIR